MPCPDAADHIQRMRAQWRDHVARLTGQPDATGLEIMAMVRIAANLYENAVAQSCSHAGLSGPRLGLLLRLLAEEQRGNPDGLTPTALSHFHNVSKNTISALLRGLEEQGLIQRVLDPADRRVFRIRLSDAGRELAKVVAPQHVACLNDLIAGLTPEERAQLLDLLGKLHRSILAHGQSRTSNAASNS